MIQKRDHGKSLGWTVYLGSRKSEAMIRIYDKASLQKVAGPWIRLELEAHQDFADALAREYLSRGAIAVVEQIARRLRFVDPNPTDSNPRRAPAASWWSDFIGSVLPGDSLLVGEKPVTTIERLAMFVEKQAGPAMATVLKAEGGALDGLLAILGRSAYRLKPKHYAALALAGAA